MKNLLKFIGTFIIVHLTCVIIDALCLGGFAVTVHVISDFSLKNLIWGIIVSLIVLTIASSLLQFIWGMGFAFCSNRSKIIAIVLIIYSLVRFSHYCVPVLSGETGNEAFAKLIEMAQEDAGDLYSIGAWISIAFAFIFYTIMGLMIYSNSSDE